MTTKILEIPNATETCFFSHYLGELAQWIDVSVIYRGVSPQAAQAVICAGGMKVGTDLMIDPGQSVLRCYAPVIWPEQPDFNAEISIQIDGKTCQLSLTIGRHRPWVVYLNSDVCTDDTWVYANYSDMRKDDADLTAAELFLVEQTRSDPDWRNRNHYNLVHALSLEYFEEHYPELVDRLVEAVRRDEIALNPFYNMTLTKNVSLEEQIRHFYTTRRWQMKYGLEMKTANHQETPSIAYDMPGVLVGCGVEYLVKGILPYECPWVARLTEPPLFEWVGADGTPILLRRRNWDYVEGMFILSGVEKTNQSLHEKILPEYAALENRYPFNAVALLGCYGDLRPFEPGMEQSKDLPIKKVETIRAYNSQEWEYPCLVNASHPQFLEEIKRQIKERGIQLERYQGDYGLGWDAWPACLAGDVAGWRRAQERSGTADKLMAILQNLSPDWFASQENRLEQAWKNLWLLADHAWNGANDANRQLNADLRRVWQREANSGFDQLIEEGLSDLASKVSRSSEGQYLVFNALPWKRSGIVQLEGLPEGGQALVGLDDGSVLAVQRIQEGNSAVSVIQADEIPSVGYRVYARVSQPIPQSESPWKIGANSLEGPFYRVEVSPVSGGICRLLDKTRELELVDLTSSYHLNQCVYSVDEQTEYDAVYQLMRKPTVNRTVEYTPAKADISIFDVGPVLARLKVCSEFRDIQLITTITLYAGIDRIDIKNQVTKSVSSEKQELHFAFPFNFEDCELRYETPGAIIDPCRDHLPGAGLSAAVVRHFVDIFNQKGGVLLSMADSFLVQFGQRSTTEDPLKVTANGMVWALAMGNLYDANEAIRDQNGQTQFTFRFGLGGHSTGFDPVRAIRFGWEDNNDLLSSAIPSSGQGKLTIGTTSFMSVSPETAILTSLKPGEESGMIARVWNCGWEAASGRVVHAPALNLHASMQTDLLERDLSHLPHEDGQTVFELQANGIISMRLLE